MGVVIEEADDARHPPADSRAEGPKWCKKNGAQPQTDSSVEGPKRDQENDQEKVTQPTAESCAQEAQPKAASCAQEERFGTAAVLPPLPEKVVTALLMCSRVVLLCNDTRN